MRSTISFFLVILLGCSELFAQEDTMDVTPKQTLRLDTLTGRHYDPSLSASQILGRSAMLPGWGQITNRQTWKVPLVAGGLAGGIYGIYESGRQYRDYNDATLRRLDTSVTDSYVGIYSLTELLQRSNRAKTLNTAAIFFTVYTYGINVFDAYASAKIVRDKKMHPPVKAAFLSALFPGLGQAYNRKYWKVPIAMAAVGTGIGFIAYNTKQYNDHRMAYITRTDNNPDTEYETSETIRYQTDDLTTLYDYYRRNRDLSYIVTVGIYALNIIDAIVDGHLYNFDISDDLSNRFEPRVRPTLQYDWGTNSSYPGLSLKMRF